MHAALISQAFHGRGHYLTIAGANVTPDLVLLRSSIIKNLSQVVLQQYDSPYH